MEMKEYKVLRDGEIEAGNNMPIPFVVKKGDTIIHNEELFGGIKDGRVNLYLKISKIEKAQEEGILQEI